MATQLYDILPSRPFGNGTDGVVTLSSDPHTRRTGSGSSGNNTLTINSGAYSNGDVVLIHETDGLSFATEDNWDVAQIVSGGGTTSLTLGSNLTRNFSTAQVLDVKMYSALTINSFTPTGWGGSTGGIVALAARSQCNWAGTITLAGNSGSSSGSDQGGKPGVGGGFRGGWNSMDGSHAQQGGGYPGGGSENQTANGNGGGGGNPSGDTGGAGGGGAVAGSNASKGSAVGGSAVGNTTLTSAILGGGGGGGRNDGDQNAGGGGSGGGGIFLWVNELTYVSGGVNLNGGNGGSSSAGATSGGGGGGGGFGFFNFANGTINSNFKALAGSGQNNGGNGGNGRFRVNYGRTFSGNTNPAASFNLDTELVEPVGASQIIG